MLCSPNATPTAAGPGGCRTPSTEMAAADGTVTFKVTGVSAMENRILLVVFGISMLFASKSAVVTFKFQVPGPCFPPIIPPILKFNCSAPDAALTSITQNAVSTNWFRQGSGEDVTIPGTIL